MDESRELFELAALNGGALDEVSTAPNPCRPVCVLPIRRADAGEPDADGRVRRLLAHEGAVAGNAVACAAAAGRVYDRSLAHLAPLLGTAGVRALLARSVKLRQGEFPFLEAAVVTGSTTLRECLHAQDAAVAAASAEALFGTFFALITTFIGERLTTQALRRAWPMIDEIAPSATRPDGETDK